jgi:hypothetical protein
VEYDMPINCHLESNKWHAFPWPLLGIQFEKDSGFAIKVDYPENVKNSFMQVIVLGYENLFPLSYDMYYLVDTYNKPRFKIHMPAGKYEFVFEPIQNILEEEMTYDFEDSEKLKMISDYEKPDEPVESSINNDLYNLIYRLDR